MGEQAINLSEMQAVLLEGNQLESDIVYQVLRGFGIRKVSRFRSSLEACDYLKTKVPGLMVVGIPDRDGLDGHQFIKWVRRRDNEQLRAAPVILIAGQTSEESVLLATDNGANFVVAKPITARVLFDRILWLTRDPRAFIISDSYVGPDRRFSNLGPPSDTEGCRSADLPLQFGQASTPNLSQDEIDDFMVCKATSV